MADIRNSHTVRTIALLIVVCLVSIPAQAQYGGGSGTADDAYQIATAEDLMLLGDSPEDYGRHFILTADIDLGPKLPGRKVFDKAVIAPDTNDAEWWFQGRRFNGVFDGDGHRILHLTITGQNYLGLFGQLASGAEIKDLSVVNVNLTGSEQYVGGLVGQNDGAVTRCYSSGAVSGTGYRVGGLVGYNRGDVTDCYSSGTVTGDFAVGGLVGYNYYGVIATSYSTGTVRGNGDVGGLLGTNTGGTVTGCYSTGTVSGGYYVGGLLGDNDGGSIASSYSTGTVTGNSVVGGLVGSNSGGVLNSYSTGTVSGNEEVGGLVGTGKPVRVKDSVWDVETSGLTVSAGGTGLTTAEMMDPEVLGLNGLGGDPNWVLDSGRDYPRLVWEGTAGQVIPVAFRAFLPDPHTGAVDVSQPLILRWRPGGAARGHDVYIGEDAEAVANATTESAGIYRGRQAGEITTHDPDILELEKTYYWRIDEVNEADAGSPWKGSVWSFTTANFIVVDDFEAYDDFCNRIFYTWLDGWGFSGDPDCGVPAYPGNGTGSTVGFLCFPCPWPPVHGGGQSMPFQYNNSLAPYYSETERVFAVPQNWARDDVKGLTLWFHGETGNTPEALYVAVEDSLGQVRVATHPNPEALQGATWQQWNIALTQFSNAAVNLKSVKKIYIGIGDRGAPQRGGTGQLYFDDIRLYRTRCVASLLKPEADLSGNCVVDLGDIEILAGEWLQSGPGLAADLDADGEVDFGDFAQIADAWLEELLWPQP